MNVQTWLQQDTAPDKDRQYEMVSCPACTQMHFVNLGSGRLLGDTGD